MTSIHRARTRRARATAVAAVAVLLGGLFAATTQSATAATPTVPLPQAADFEQPITLLAASGDLSSGLSVESATSYPKHFWVNGFSTSAQSVTWSVSTTTATSYRVSLLANLGSGSKLTLASSGGETKTLTTTAGGWTRTDGGDIALPAGTSTLTLSHTSGSGNQIKSIELVPSGAWADYQARITAFKKASEATRVELSESGLGLMFQYGGWSYPATGSNPDLETHTNTFDVKAFADLVQQAGVKHVIWSITWWNYTMQAPISAVDNIVGNGDRTASRDLIGELADEFDKRGIMFFLYYHIGQDEHLGYESTDFWRLQQFPKSFTPTGLGDRSLTLNNWKTIVTQIGERYGTKLDGWFFDDGLIYYPANFEELGKAARAGNPARIVSWNAWIVADYTQFQDVAFGEEGCTNLPGAGSPAVGGNGMIQAGKDAGLLQHCMQRMEQDWGVRSANQPITTQQTAASLQCSVSDRLARNGAVSLNLMMYYPGVPSSTSLAEVKKLANLPPSSGMVNDHDPAVAYTGAWGYASGRGSAGDYCGDVTYTQTNGASLQYTFTGTGVDVLGPVQDPVKGDVYIDGQKVATIDAPASATYKPQQVLASVKDLPNGSHTLKVVRTGGGQYFQIDALRVSTAPPPVAATATVTPKCLGDKAYLYTSVKNDEAVAISAKTVTPHGTKEFASIAAGKTGAAAFNSTLKAIPAGTTTVTGTTTDGRTFTRTVTHAALTCG